MRTAYSYRDDPAVPAFADDRPIICNGFKDESYIEAVTLATKLGRTIIPVVENFEELNLILKHADAYGVRPRLGVQLADDQLVQQLDIEKGALILKVEPGSAAAQAGLQGTQQDKSGHIQLGDVIV